MPATAARSPAHRAAHGPDSTETSNRGERCRKRPPVRHRPGFSGVPAPRTGSAPRTPHLPLPPDPADGHRAPRTPLALLTWRLRERILGRARRGAATAALPDSERPPPRRHTGRKEGVGETICAEGGGGEELVMRLVASAGETVINTRPNGDCLFYAFSQGS